MFSFLHQHVFFSCRTTIWLINHSNQSINQTFRVAEVWILSTQTFRFAGVWILSPQTFRVLRLRINKFWVRCWPNVSKWENTFTWYQIFPASLKFPRCARLGAMLRKRSIFRIENTFTWYQFVSASSNFFRAARAWGQCWESCPFSKWGNTFTR